MAAAVAEAAAEADDEDKEDDACTCVSYERLRYVAIVTGCRKLLKRE